MYIYIHTCRETEKGTAPGAPCAQRSAGGAGARLKVQSETQNLTQTQTEI